MTACGAFEAGVSDREVRVRVKLGGGGGLFFCAVNVASLSLCAIDPDRFCRSAHLSRRRSRLASSSADLMIVTVMPGIYPLHWSTLHDLKIANPYNGRRNEQRRI